MSNKGVIAHLKAFHRFYNVAGMNSDSHLNWAIQRSNDSATNVHNSDHCGPWDTHEHEGIEYEQ